MTKFIVSLERYRERIMPRRSGRPMLVVNQG
jgi:hypothetical protein